MRFRMKTIALLFVGVVSLIANAENHAAGLYGNQRQKDSAYKPQQTSTGANPSLLPYDMRAQRLPDVGPYNGRGVYNPDSWPAPTEYIGQDGTILYCDKKGNVYDSNGVRYGKRESSGLLRKLNKSEQLYDAAFSPNYADEAFKAEERKFENDNKSKKITKSSFEDEIKQTGEADVQKQLKAMGDGGADIDVSFNSTVDEWRDDDDIASAVVVYGYSQDWKDYIKILDASIGYLEQVLKDEKGDASFAKWQKEEMGKLGEKITKTVFSAKGWSRKDATRVMLKMHEDYGIGGKLRRRLELIEEIERRGLFDSQQNAPQDKPSEPNVAKDAKKGTDVTSKEQKTADSQVGVRGWCHCWDKTPPYSGCLKEVGIANMRDVAELVNAMAEISQTYDGAYRYTICDQCGKCFTIAKVGKKWSDTGDEIVDTTIFNKYKERAGRSIPYHHFEDMLAKARDKLLVIPDGQIVISGICSCKYPDPMRVGVQIPFGEYYVCVFCGRVRLPDDTNSIPLGPTEWERRMGRSGKPFPGFEK